MKRIIKTEEPALLISYRTNNPNGRWQGCKNNQNRREQIQQYLLNDQGGLCAYCEVDLKMANAQGVADFRVEHFHPKSDISTDHNWHLDWQNLLACCHGGSRPDVVDEAERASSPDHSCDVPKADHDWDELILNPLQLAASPCLFRYSRATGAVSVDDDNCETAGVDSTKAQNNIDYLRLDANRLKRLRKAELDRVNEQLRQLVQNGITLEAARDKLARALIKKDVNGHWPRFFSALRHYLGAAAEQQLVTIGYLG